MAAAANPIRGVLFDLDDTLVPFQTIARWQWAWRPNGPVLPDRRAHAAIRRSLHDWDRRRWRGLTGAEPPTTPESYRDHLRATLLELADRPLPDEETAAVLGRFLKPLGPFAPFPDVLPALRGLEARGLPYAVVTPLPAEVARSFLHRAGIPEDRLPPPAVGERPPPDRSAFRRAAAGLSAQPSEVLYVGDLYWSDVRAAGRAGLRAALLDRDDRAPPARGPRMRSLAELPGILEARSAPGPSDPDPESLGSPEAPDPPPPNS